MILVFAGAGASKATNPDLYPTTIEYYQRLSNQVKRNELFKSVEAYLTKQKAQQEQVIIDIEEILWALDDLTIFTKQTIDQDNLIGILLNNKEFSKNTLQDKPLVVNNFFRNVNNKIEELTSQINLHVYELYSRLPSQEDLLRGWIPLLRKVLDTNERVEIFTTNYDQVIESAIEFVDNEHGSSRIKTGRVLSVQPHLNLKLWDSTDAGYDLGANGLFTKLHGSIDWSRSNETIYVGNPLYSGNLGRHVIIYPGFKDRDGVNFSNPFNNFHEHFRAAVSKADKFVFVGFAFRDPFIRKVIESHMLNDASVFIIDPMFNPKRINFPTTKIHHISSGFNEDAINELLLG